MILQYTRNWVYICSTSSAFYNRHSNTMSLPKGIYRIHRWGAHEHPQYLTIIDGLVSVAGPDVPNLKDQEVTRRFWRAYIPFLTNFSVVRRAPRERKRRHPASRPYLAFSFPFLGETGGGRQKDCAWPGFRLSDLWMARWTCAAVTTTCPLLVSLDSGIPIFPSVCLPTFIWTGSIRVPDKDLITGIVVSPFLIFPPQVFFSLFILMTWGTDLLKAPSWAS